MNRRRRRCGADNHTPEERGVQRFPHILDNAHVEKLTLLINHGKLAGLAAPDLRTRGTGGGAGGARRRFVSKGNVVPIARPFEFDFVARDEVATCAPELDFGSGARRNIDPGRWRGLPLASRWSRPTRWIRYSPKAAWMILSRSRRSRRTLFSRCSPLALPGSRSSLRRWRIPRHRLSTPS